jgi:hypothetical protein
MNILGKDSVIVLLLFYTNHGKKLISKPQKRNAKVPRN